MTERDLSEEVASDITHYDNDYLFFYIYDKENIIKNKFNFIQTYESKKVDEKRIHVPISGTEVRTMTMEEAIKWLA